MLVLVSGGVLVGGLMLGFVIAVCLIVDLVWLLV